MLICLERGADCLHVAQLMPLLSQNAIVSCLRLVLPLWYRLTPVVLEKRPLNGCVCVRVSRKMSSRIDTPIHAGSHPP